MINWDLKKWTNHGLSPSAWNHLALSEQIIFEWSQNALEHSAEKGEIAFQDEMLMKIFTDRSQKSKTLDVLEPTGKFHSIDEALDHFDKLRAKHIDYIEDDL